MFNGIIHKLEEVDHVTVEEFREMLHGLRITNDDIQQIEKWLIDKGVVQRIVLNEHKKTKNDYIILAVIKELSEKK
jgi:hypothetical protein